MPPCAPRPGARREHAGWHDAPDPCHRRHGLPPPCSARCPPPGPAMCPLGARMHPAEHWGRDQAGDWPCLRGPGARLPLGQRGRERKGVLLPEERCPVGLEGCAPPDFHVARRRDWPVVRGSCARGGSGVPGLGLTHVERRGLAGQGARRGRWCRSRAIEHGGGAGHTQAGPWHTANQAR